MSDKYPLDHKIKRPHEWIGSETHDAGSWPFHARQMARIRAAQQQREDEAKAVVRPIKGRK